MKISEKKGVIFKTSGEQEEKERGVKGTRGT